MNALEQSIRYRFHDKELLELALTHPSLAGKANNQRLEFLGDAVLGLCVTKILYDIYPEEKEGELARRRAALVCGEMLADVARSLSLGEWLKIAANESHAGGRDNDSNLEDALEALIGAIYLDGGIEAAEKFVSANWLELAKKITAPPKDAKTALQEWSQARGLPVPLYRVIESTGPAHAPEFTIEVTVEGYPSQQAKAASKRAAEQASAGMLLKSLEQL